MARDAAGQKRLRALCDRLETLSDERCRGLLLELLQSAQQVAAGPQAVKEDLATLKVPAHVLHVCFTSHIGCSPLCKRRTVNASSYAAGALGEGATVDLQPISNGRGVEMRTTSLLAADAPG